MVIKDTKFPTCRQKYLYLSRVSWLLKQQLPKIWRGCVLDAHRRVSASNPSFQSQTLCHISPGNSPQKCHKLCPLYPYSIPQVWSDKSCQHGASKSTKNCVIYVSKINMLSIHGRHWRTICVCVCHTITALHYITCADWPHGQQLNKHHLTMCKTWRVAKEF